MWIWLIGLGAAISSPMRARCVQVRRVVIVAPLKPSTDHLLQGGRRDLEVAIPVLRAAALRIRGFGLFRRRAADSLAAVTVEDADRGHYGGD